MVVLLKRLPDALRDGDRVLAVVRGTAANQDGRSATTSRHRRWTRRSRCTGRRWRPRSVDARHGRRWSRHTAPAPRSVTRSSTEAWPGIRRRRQPLRAGIGQEQSRAHRVGRGHTRADQGDLVAAARRGATECCTSPACPMTSPGLTTGLSVPQAITPWPSSNDHAPRRGGGVVVRDVGNQRARDRRTSTRDTLRRRHTTGATVSGMASPLLFALSSTSDRRTAPHLAAASRLGGEPGEWRRDGAAGSGLHAGASACPPAGAHRGASPASLPELTEASARGRRRRHPVSGRGRPGRPGTGVGVLRAGFAVGRDGRGAAGHRTGVRRDRRRRPSR